MKSSQNLLLLLLLVFFAFACGQPRSARQDEAEEKTEAAETLIEENLEAAAEETPGELDESEESNLSEGTSEPEPEPHPETEPEPEPEGSAGNSDEKLEESDDLDQQTNTSKKCQKCFRSAFRARHSEFCDGCGGSEGGAKPLEKDGDRLRRKCRRCSNSKFAEKHQNFCTIRCKDLQQPLTTSSEPTPTPEPEHRPITSDDLKKKKKERRKGQRKTNKKKDVKLPEDEMSSSSQLSIPLKDPIEEEELGPLENLIKYIINQK